MLKLYTTVQLAFFRASEDDERGQALSEYALILALVAVTAIVALHFLSNGVKSALTSAATSL